MRNCWTWPNGADFSAEGPSTEFVKLGGAILGDPGWNAPDNARRDNLLNRERAFDNDLATHVNGPGPSSYWIGLDLGEQKTIRRIRFAPRRGLEGRMVGGKFQAAAIPDFAGDLVELAEISSPPTAGWNTRELEKPIVAQLRAYVPPANSFGNVAEIEFRGPGEGAVLEQQTRRMLADRRRAR